MGSPVSRLWSSRAWRSFFVVLLDGVLVRTVRDDAHGARRHGVDEGEGACGSSVTRVMRSSVERMARETSEAATMATDEDGRDLEALRPVPHVLVERVDEDDRHQEVGDARAGLPTGRW